MAPAMKLKLKGSRLDHADVQFISLVERGATRAPFKIQKQEKPTMINLDFRRIMKGRQDSKPSIVGYVIAKTDKTPQIEAALKDVGVKIDTVVEDGDVLVLRQDDSDPAAKENVVVKLAPDFMVVCKGFDPYRMVEDMSFGEILKSQGFMPGFSMASEALYTSIRNSLASAEDGSDAVSKIDDAVSEFHDYVLGLAKVIPQAAFKAMESFRKVKDEAEEEVKLAAAMSDAEKAHMAKMAPKDKMAFIRSSSADRAKVMGVKKEDTDAAAKAAQEAVLKAEAEKKVKDEAEKVAKAAADAAAKVVAAGAAEGAKDIAAVVKEVLDKALKGVGDTITGAIAPVTKSITDLTAKVELAVKDSAEAKVLAKKSADAVNATLNLTAEDDDASRSQKQETGSLGIIDTAFNRNVRKSDKDRPSRNTM